MSLILLIGMPGVGKTYWGRQWAAAYDYQFLDLDEQIEAKAGESIPDIFRRAGENGFRDLESATLRNLISTAAGKHTIISTGGGTPAFHNNMELMLERGIVVYLTSNIETLIRQIADSGVSRPLLSQSVADRTMLEQILRRRAPFYERAHLSLALGNLRTDTFAQILKECTDRQS